MKTKFFTLVTLSIFVLLIIGCKKENPESLFTVEKETYFVSEPVSFSNESKLGSTYYWNFGDGNSSKLKNPSHTYEFQGEYVVTLQVMGAKKTEPSEFSKTINIENSNSLNGIDDILKNSFWECDSITNLYYNCNSMTATMDNSLKSEGQNIRFTNDGIVMRKLYNTNIFVSDYIIISDSELIIITPQLQDELWQYEINGDRLTMVRDRRQLCSQDGTNLNYNGYLNKYHYKKG